MIGIKHSITNSPTARRIAYYAGWAVAKRLRRRVFVKGPTVFILMYHKVSPKAYPYYGASVEPNLFEKQIQIILKYYQVVALEDLLDRQNVKAEKDLVAITFDDGYKGVYRWAYPILHKHNLPATIFLTTDLIESQQVLWHDYLAFILYSALKSRSYAKINYDGLPAKIKKSLNSFFNERRDFAHKTKFLRQTSDYLKTYDQDDRKRILNELRGRLRLDTPFDLSDVMLSWQEVHEMSNNRITFGSHTCSHEPLSALDQERVKSELKNSKKIIESQLQKPVTTFAYPYGMENDFTSSNVEQVKRCGFQLAVTGIRGNESLPLRNPHTLLRRAVENTPYLFF